MPSSSGGSSHTRAGNHQTHYQLNKDYYRQKAERNKAKVRKLIRAAKAHPCADCKIQYPYYVLDFDHVRGKKLFNLSSSYSHTGYKKVEEEIAKCDVVCANCHRFRTAKRMGL